MSNVIVVLLFACLSAIVFVGFSIEGAVSLDWMTLRHPYKTSTISCMSCLTKTISLDVEDDPAKTK